MAERLREMKGNPDGDVFWNSELSLTQWLADDGALEAYLSPSAKDIPSIYKDAQNRWTGFGCRARVILFNTSLIKREDVPKSLDGFANPRFKGRACVPKPVTGTTQSHLASLVLAMGEEKAFKLFHAWHDNGVVMVESNSDSRNRVAEGFFTFGLTDSDDAFEALAGNKPVDFIVPDQAGDWHGAYLVPNTISILNRCRHSQEAKQFVDYLLKPEMEAWLSQHGAHQIPVRDIPGVKPLVPLGELKPASVDFEKLGRSVRPIGEKIYRIWEK
jgi:iron(III) transport system substrate-binding protein